MGRDKQIPYPSSDWAQMPKLDDSIESSNLGIPLALFLNRRRPTYDRYLSKLQQLSMDVLHRAPARGET